MPRIKPRTLSLGERAELQRLQTAYKARLARSGGQEHNSSTIILKPSKWGAMTVERSMDNDV